MTEQECRAMRLDRIQFKTLEDAIQFGEKNKLQTRGVYKYPEGYYKLCRYTKGNTELYGRFIGGKYVEGFGTPFKEPKGESNRKKVDGKKFGEYLDSRQLNRSDLSRALHRSSAFITDIVKRNHVDILAWEKICDILEVPTDYFDFKEKEPEPEIEEPKVLIEETDHDLLVSLLLSQKKIEALLMEIVSLLK